MSRKSRPATTEMEPSPSPSPADAGEGSSGARSGYRLLGRAALVLFPGEFVHRGILHDFLAGNLPGLLDDPRERTVLTSRLILDLLQHLFVEVQALLALVGTAHWTTMPPVWSRWDIVRCPTVRCQGLPTEGITNRPSSFSGDAAVAPGASYNSVSLKHPTARAGLTGWFGATILAGYFKRQRRTARGRPWKGPG